LNGRGYYYFGQNIKIQIAKKQLSTIDLAAGTFMIPDTVLLLSKMSTEHKQKFDGSL
jgi:hypothetical protein